MPFNPPNVNYNPINTIIARKSFLTFTPAAAGPGQAQIITNTVVGPATGSGNLVVTVTGSGIAGSPLTINVGILNGDTAAQVADKIAIVLAGTAAITALYGVSNPAFGATVVLTAITNAANDGTLALTWAAGLGISASGAAVATQAGIAPSGVVSLIGKVMKYNNKFTTVQREVPDSAGLLRPDRIVPTKQDEDFMFETEEVFLLPGLFGGMNGGFLTGTARIFVVDPADVTGTNVAVASNTFNCTLEMDGGLDFSAGKVVNASLKVTSLQKVLLTAHATA